MKHLCFQKFLLVRLGATLHSSPTCLKFKSELIANLKHIESFTQKFVAWTATKDLSKVEELDAELEDAKKAAKPKPTAKSKRRKG